MMRLLIFLSSEQISKEKCGCKTTRYFFNSPWFNESLYGSFLTMSPNWKIWKQSHLYIASFKIGDIRTQHKNTNVGFLNLSSEVMCDGK